MDQLSALGVINIRSSFGYKKDSSFNLPREEALPGPPIGFLQELVQRLDYHAKG